MGGLQDKTVAVVFFKFFFKFFFHQFAGFFFFGFFLRVMIIIVSEHC